MKRRHWLVGIGSFLVTLILILTVLLPVFDRRFFAQAQLYGLISDAVVYTYEYDPDEGLYCDAIKLSSDGEYSYYAIVSTGDTGAENDGYIRTVKINESTGRITNSLIDSLEYDTSDGYGPSIYKVGDEMYVICYCDAGASRQTLVTVSISDVGVIPAAVTETFTLALDGIDASSVSDILHVFGNTYVVAYTDVDGDGQLATINITSAGDIAAAVTDTEEFDTSNGYFPQMCSVDNDTIALVYETTDTTAASATGRDGMLMTYNITYGLITDTPADSWEFNGNIGRWPSIIHVSDNTYVIACEGADNDGFVNSTSITSTGDLSGTSIDNIEFDTADAGFQVLFEVGNNSARNRKVFGLSYQGGSGDGFIRTFQVDRDGNMPSTTFVDSLEFDTADNLWYAPVLFVDVFLYAVINAGASNDGFIRSFDLYVNHPPVISDEEPDDDAIDVSSVPSLSVDISDVGDIVNITWTTNSTGVWGSMGSNTSYHSYGAISDVKIYYEFDAQEGLYPDCVRLGTSDYYAVACTGDTGTENDGFIRVIQAWNTNGTIRNSVINSYEYDASDGFYPRILRISEGVYAIAYYDDTANLIKVVTTNISETTGTCVGSIVDTISLSYDTVNTYPLDFMKVTDNVYVIAYTEITTVDGWLNTIWINSTGTINNSLLDSEEFNETSALHPRLALVDSDTIAIIYYDTAASDGYITTYNITSAGLIGDTRADVKEYDTTQGTQPDIAKISGNMFVIAYEGSSTDGYIGTHFINNDGNILGSDNTANETYEFDKADGGYQRIKNLGDNMILVTYQGTSTYGWTKTFSVSDTGNIISFEYDELRFDADTCLGYSNFVSMGNDCYFVAWSGTGNDGFCGTFKVGNDTSDSFFCSNNSMSEPGTTYWWNVTVNEYYGVNNVSETYSFTTEDEGIVWYHNTGDNSYFDIGDLHFDPIEIDTDYVMFNTTDFKVVGENRTNVTIHFINTSIIDAGTGDLLVDFSAHNPGDETVWFNISGFDPSATYDIERDGDMFDTDTANVSGDIQFSDTFSGNEYRYTIYFSSGGGTSWNVVASSINGSIKNITRWLGTTPPCEVNGSIKNVSGWRAISTSINGSIKNVSLWCVVSASLNGSIKNLTLWRGIIPPCEVNGSIKNTSGWIVISSLINGSIKNTTIWKEVATNWNGSIKNMTTWKTIITSINGTIKNVTYEYPTELTLGGLTNQWNVTWNGTRPEGSITIHPVFCNSSGDRNTTVEINIAVNDTMHVDTISFWGMYMQDQLGSPAIINSENVTVLVSIDNTTWGVLQDDQGSGMGRFPAGWGYLYWNWTTSPPGCEPFTYVPGSGYMILSNTTVYARYMINITEYNPEGIYINNTGNDWEISIMNVSDGWGIGNIDGVFHTVKAVVEEQFIWYDVPTEYDGAIKNITMWTSIIPACEINGSIKNMSSWVGINTTINGSIKNISAWRNIVPPCEVNGSIKNISIDEWTPIIVTINGSIKNITGWVGFSTAINGSIKNITRWVIIDSSLNGSIKNITAAVWTVISSSINGSIKNITLAVITPFNVNLHIHNPNPGNGTHLTEATGFGVGGNYIKRDAAGLTTSIEILYLNFTTPPAIMPGDYSMEFDSLNYGGPTVQNDSTVYATANANTSGQVIPGNLYCGQLENVGDYYIERGYLIFNTTTLPDEAVVTSAYITMVIFDDGSDTDFIVNVTRRRAPCPHNPMIPGDYFRNAFGDSCGSRNTTGYADEDWFNITLAAASYADIDETGHTYFGLRSDQDRKQNAPGVGTNEWIGFYGPGGVAPTKAPHLIIDYTIPSSNWHHYVNLTWYSNSSGPWVPYYVSYVDSNGTVTVPNVNFSGVSSYWWNISYNSNHTQYGNTSYWSFETVSSSGGGIGYTMTGSSSQTNSIVVGGPLLLSGVVVGLIFNRRRRKRNNDGEL